MYAMLMQVVITDFGLSKTMPDEGLLLTACGSPQYVAPEVLLGKGYDKKADLWSCGVIAFALLSGYTPFYSADVQVLFQKIVNCEYDFHEQYWSTQSTLAKDFVEKCLCDQADRMTISEALSHPWIATLSSAHHEIGRGNQLKRALNPAKAVSAMSSADHATQVRRMHELQLLRRQMGTASPSHLERLSKFLEDFKKEFKDAELLIPGTQGPPSGEKTAPCIIDLDSVASTNDDEVKDDAEALTDPTDEMDIAETPLSPPKPEAHVQEGESSKTPSYTRHYIRGPMSGSHPEKETKTAEVLNELLEHYRTAERPAFSRVDPSIEVRPNSTTVLAKALKMVPTLFNQSLSIGGIIASHAIYGPPKKSWGVEMSIITKTIREVAKHSDLASIPVLQKMFDLARFLPVPEDGLITPVTFRVKRRNLRGFLAETDAQETGKRELTGEWIVGKQTWRRLQTDWQGGKRSANERVLLFIHGGAYYIMSAITHRPLTIALSKYCECRVFSVNYRLAPSTVFPGALADCVAAWFRLVDDLHIPPNNVVVAADSAGAGLAIALMMYLRDNKYPLPGGGVLYSPWVDLTMSCDSWETNKEFDFLPRPPNGDHMHPVAAYLGPNFEKYLTHPYVSPLFGNMEGLPPLLIQTGDAEVLRDENILFAHKCSLAGVPVRHEIYEDCVHVFQFFLFLDASRKALQSTRHFIRTALDKRPKRQASTVSAGTREQLDNEMSGGMNNTHGQKVEPSTGLPTEPEKEEDEAPFVIQDIDPSEDEEQDWALDNASDTEKDDASAKEAREKDNKSTSAPTPTIIVEEEK